MILFFLFSSPLFSVEPLPPELGAGMPEEKLKDILEQNIGNMRKVWDFRLKNQKAAAPRIRIPWPDLFQKAGAWILRGVLGLVIAALVLAAGIYGYRRRGRFPSRNPSPEIFRPEPAGPPLPSALLEEARRLYLGGFPREAWGRCYAASLGALTLRWGLRFPPGATEYRCLALVRRWAQDKAGPADSPAASAGAAFAGFIRHWVAFFYGGLPPPEGAFEEALAWLGSLCEKPAPGGAGDSVSGPEKPLPGGAARG
jgi:hypothetical protein